MRGLYCLMLFILVCGGCHRKKVEIPFGAAGDFYGTKIDFAKLEHTLPLTRAHLMSLTPDAIKKMSQEQVEQIYARLTAGPIPDGPYEGEFFAAPGGGLSRLGEVMGGLDGLTAAARLSLAESLGTVVWRGRLFDKNSRIMRNMLYDRTAIDLVLKKLSIDPGQIQSSNIDGKSVYLMFPAKMYCGQSLLDSRRESIVLDHLFNDELPGYNAPTDRLVGRNGLMMRNEMRMVRPGLYLGRAYMNRLFVANFVVWSDAVQEQANDAFASTGRIDEDCSAGTQRITASR